ncbi:MAG: DUF1801 domain-containing protein [Saprospiraceae bacterium]|nr:DUF1801 domain-containing protein [Saprospiraceae bacterium]
MAKNKTTATQSSVFDFLQGVADEKKREDGFRLLELMQEQTGLEPKMWGPSIIGFGTYHYRYESGHEGDAPLVGFSPRASAISLYLAPHFEGKEALLARLGKHKAAVACIYIKKLGDIDTAVFAEMIDRSIAYTKKLYPE